MDWTSGYIAVDWGTTNRRAYRVDSHGKCVDEFEDSSGVLSVPKDGFPDAVAQIRKRLGEAPMLLAGMVGSNRGWAEVPYVHCPAGFSQLASNILMVAPDAGIVPGLAFVGDGRADVMRGEEVQVLGALAESSIPDDCMVCHPGTHNKWVIVEQGRVRAFRTVMTGELFNLLRQHSILSDLLGNDATIDRAFEAGAAHGFHCDDLLSDLFAIRARVLLGEAEARNAGSYASGLLIGSDVRVGLRDAGELPIVVMGRPELTRLYAAALRVAGKEATEHDGERSFLAGIGRIAEMMK